MSGQNIRLLAGFNNTYDGSSQGQLYFNSNGDTVGLYFSPYKFQKTNVFLDAECDAGYAFPSSVLPWFLYTGLDFKLWYRDLMDNQGELYYSTDVSNWETYYWFSVPLGINLARAVNPRWLVGADASVSFMVYGGMQVGLSSGGSSANYPPVTLGNRASVKVELFTEKKRDNRPALRFAPYFLYYAFGRSNTAVGGDNQSFFEPSSNSFLFGATLSWEFLEKPFR